MRSVLTCLLLIGSIASFSQKRDSLDIMIGQMIHVGIMDFYNDSARNSAIDLISEGKVGGMIFFEKNLTKKNTQANLAEMIATLQKSADIPLLMGIDEEGGKVNRLKPKYGFPKTVTAANLGRINDLDTTRFYSERTASTLQQHGLNINYAPVVDVAINPENTVIVKYERSFSEDYQEVIRHAGTYMKGHEPYQVATVLKHFPGHGSSAVDTHKGVADVSETWQVEELYPYMELIKSGEVKAIMSAHIVNRTLDESMLPATLSQKVITGLLREQLGFDGVVFTDDMHMGAIAKHYGTEEAVTLAINADVDVLMFSNNIFDDEITSAGQLHGIIREKVESGEIDRATIQKSYARIMKLKEYLGLTEPDYQKNLQKRLKKLY